MLLGTKARYAVMAMVELALAPQGRAVSLADIAQKQEISLPYLEQIFPHLKRQELVTSLRGPGGGYRLARAAELINVAQIVAAVEESVRMTRCELHKADGCMSNKTRCLTHDVWEGLTDHITEYLASITLADICARRVRPVPLAQLADA